MAVNEQAAPLDRGRGNPAPAGLRAGTAPPDVRVLQLRRVVHDHLDPVRLPHPVRLRHAHRRPGRHRLGLAVRRRHDPVRRPVDGRGVLQLPDRRRAVLLVGQAGPAQRGGLVLVHRLVQLPGPGRGDRGHRLRRLALHPRVPDPGVQPERGALDHGAHLRDRAGCARHAEPVRHPAGRAAERHQRVVAPPRRADHRRRAGLRPVAPPVGQLRASGTSTTGPAWTSPRSTSS